MKIKVSEEARGKQAHLQRAATQTLGKRWRVSQSMLERQWAFLKMQFALNYVVFKMRGNNYSEVQVKLRPSSGDNERSTGDQTASESRKRLGKGLFSGKTAQRHGEQGQYVNREEP